MMPNAEPTCSACAAVVESPETIHVLRKCAGCGRELRIFEPGDHGIGMRVQKGDTPVIPSGALKLSLNPLKSAGQFSKAGIEWFWELLAVGSLPKEEKRIVESLRSVAEEADALMRASTLLKGCDLDTQDGTQRAFDVLREKRDSVEWWAFLTDMFAQMAAQAVEDGDARRAAWASACAERFRAMVTFKTNLAEVVWMGQSARRIIEALSLWDNHSGNSDEEFWQIKFTESTYVLSQVLGVPLVFVQDKAYVGGMTIAGTDARFVDYLFAVESSGEAVAIEIKTPVAKLLKSRKYRNGVYQPSDELSGSLVQVLDYRHQLLRKLDGIAKQEGKELHAFSPKCVVIIGNARNELVDLDRKRSFELFRSSLKDVEIIAYDELFRKIEVLATLFNLKRAAPLV